MTMRSCTPSPLRVCGVCGLVFSVFVGFFFESYNV